MTLVTMLDIIASLPNYATRPVGMDCVQPARLNEINPVNNAILVRLLLCD